jgi:hypothetical protein
MGYHDGPFGNGGRPASPRTVRQAGQIVMTVPTAGEVGSGMMDTTLHRRRTSSVQSRTTTRRVRSAVLEQRGAIARAWGRIGRMTDLPERGQLT